MDDLYDLIAKKFYEQYVGGKFRKEMYDIVYIYVKFIIDEYEDMLWNSWGDWVLDDE